VHATKIRRDLGRPPHEERATKGLGDAGDVAIAVQGQVAWLVWSDARESPREGVADIFATTLRTTDGTRATDEVRLLATARHSHSPTLAPAMTGRALVAWIEDAPTGLEAPAAVMVACLDARGRVACAPTELPTAADGRPMGVALAPSREGVRALLTRSSPGGMSLDALRLSNEAAPLAPPWPLVDLDAPASVEVPVAMTAESLVYADAEGEPGMRRIVRGAVFWGPTVGSVR
jgi:hypothetical protein